MSVDDWRAKFASTDLKYQCAKLMNLVRPGEISYSGGCICGTSHNASCRAATTAAFYTVYLVNLWRFWSDTWHHRVSPCFTSRVDGCASALRTGAFGWGLGAVIKASETTKDKKQRHQKDRRKTRVNRSNGSNNNLARESRAFHLQGCLHLLNIPSCSAPSALRQLNLDKQIYRLNCRVTPVTPDPNERSRQGTRTTRTTNTALHSAASA